jgi:hypothetical protein
MIKQTALLTTFVLASLFAEESCLPCAFLPSARPCVLNPGTLCQSDIYTQISFLYWEASERGLDYAVKNTGEQFQSNLKVYQLKFNWEPALRILLGYHLPHDRWSVDASYSFYLHNIDNKVKHHIHNNTFGEGILSVWTSPGAFLGQNIYARWQNAIAKWKINGQFFDFLLRHDLRNGSALSFQPACGLKLALIQQRYTVIYTFGNAVLNGAESLIQSQISMKNSSFNIGPEAALSTRWCLDQNWNIFGSLSGSLLASQFKVGRNEQDVSQTSSAIIGSYRYNSNYWTMRPQASLSLGVEWGDCVCGKYNVIHYAFAASYEANYWWKQNMLLRSVAAPSVQSQQLAPAQGDLFFQGLTFDILFDF